MKRFNNLSLKQQGPAFLIGFVLASQAESYLNMSVQFYGWEMVLRPGVTEFTLGHGAATPLKK